MVDSNPVIRPGRDSFEAFLAGQGIALLDGAMGTMLYARGAFISRAFEELNVSEPGMVREVHEAYVNAGADIIETNTFAANRFRLAPHGLEERVDELNRAGVTLAREAAGDRAWVAGAMGPLGVRIEPFGAIARDEARAVFRQQAEVLHDEGVDLFILETFSHLPELLEAIAAIREVSERPIVAEMRVTTGAVTPEGVDAADVAEALEAAGANVVGVNCCEALAALDALAEMRDASALPLVGQPNAGQPRSVGGRNIYLASSDYLVAWGRRAVRSGARLLGGCCGTRPEHIRALRGAIGQAELPVANTRVRRVHTRESAATPVPLLEKSPLATALHAERFPLGISLPPSRGHGSRDIARAARQMALAGVEFVSLPEGTAARAYAPPIVLAAACRHEGVLPIVHYSCRGRRVERIQSDLVGASMLGVEAVMLVTGDPLNPGAEQDAWPDLEIDSIGAVNLAVRLNHGEDLGGNAIGDPTAFHVGIRIDPTAHDQERELSRLNWKVDAGAEFAMTPPIFDPESLQVLLSHVDQSQLPVVATIWPLQSAQEAEFFEQRLAFVPVPEPIVERMRRAEEANREREEGQQIAVELALAIRPMVRGIQVVSPSWELETALSVLDTLR